MPEPIASRSNGLLLFVLTGLPIDAGDATSGLDGKGWAAAKDVIESADGEAARSGAGTAAGAAGTSGTFASSASASPAA